MKLKNKLILTFDLEFWYNSQFLENYLSESGENFNDYFTESLYPLLDLLKKKNILATFFVLGIAAEKYPEAIKKIYNDGHEIACHGYSHKRLEKLRPEEFEKEIATAVNLLEKITGQKPIGFRAPNFSLSNKTKWALNILEKYGFQYDSSIFPFKTQMYGNSKAPLGAYRISNRILELPVAVLEIFGLRIPVGGGFYFRFMPFFIYNFFLKMIRRERLPILYFHPHEFYDFIPKIKAPFWKIKLKYYGVKNGFKKLEKLLDEFEFMPLKEYIENLRN